MKNCIICGNPNIYQNEICINCYKDILKIKKRLQNKDIIYQDYLKLYYNETINILSIPNYSLKYCQNEQQLQQHCKSLYAHMLIESEIYPKRNLIEFAKTQIKNRIHELQSPTNNHLNSPIEEPANSPSHEYFDFRTQYPLKYRCTDGHFVRSKAEREIDNFLFNQSIVHVYEWHYISPNEKEYFPDFYIPQYHLILEYFGLSKENYLKVKAEKIDTYTNDNRYNFEYLLPEHDNDLEFYLTKIIQKYKK